MHIISIFYKSWCYKKKKILFEINFRFNPITVKTPKDILSTYLSEIYKLILKLIQEFEQSIITKANLEEREQAGIFITLTIQTYYIAISIKTAYYELKADQQTNATRQSPHIQIL